MSFLAIMPQSENEYLNLRVIKGSLEVIPDLDINVSDLNQKNKNKYKHFFNSGDGGITFKVDIIIKDTDKYKGNLVTDVLNTWIKESYIINVVSSAIDIKNVKPKTYIITKNSSRKQEYKHTTTWQLEFTTYRALTVHKYKNDNSAILNALKKTKAKTKSNTNKKKAECNKFKQCALKDLVFSKKKKDVKCVRYLQQTLKNNSLYLDGKLDGWFNTLTKKAVKQFQKKNKLKQTGKVDKKTFEKLVKLCPNGKTLKSATKSFAKKTTKKKKKSTKKKKKYYRKTRKRKTYAKKYVKRRTYPTVNRSRINTALSYMR